LTADVHRRQQQYIAKSNTVTLQAVQSWPIRRRLWNNTLAVLGPIL
jgi:cardiolipin synthase